MDMTPEPQVTKRDLENVMAMLLFTRAEISTVVDALQEIGKLAGVPRLQGLDIAHWHWKRAQAALRQMLRDLEDESPGLAAALQARIDEANRLRRDDKPSGD